MIFTRLFALSAGLLLFTAGCDGSASGPHVLPRDTLPPDTIPTPDSAAAAPRSDGIHPAAAAPPAATIDVPVQRQPIRTSFETAEGLLAPSVPSVSAVTEHRTTTPT